MKIIMSLIVFLFCISAFALQRSPVSSQDKMFQYELKSSAGTDTAALTIRSLTVDASSATYVDVSDNVITGTHTFITGDFVRLTDTATLPTGLSASTNYYVIKLSTTKLQLATTKAIANNAIAAYNAVIAAGGTTSAAITAAGALAVNITAVGSGNLVISDAAFNVASHGFITGDRVQLTTSSVTPAGTATSTDYWVIKKDDNLFQIGSTLANAVAGTAVAWTSSTTDNPGVGILTATKTDKLVGLAKNKVALQVQSTGVYRLTFDVPYGSADNIITLCNSLTLGVGCYIKTFNAAYVDIGTFTTSSGAAVDSNFNVLIDGSRNNFSF